MCTHTSGSSTDAWRKQRVHVDVVQALRDVADPSFFVLGCRCDEMDGVSLSRLPIDDDLEVAIVGIHGICRAEIAGLR